MESRDALDAREAPSPTWEATQWLGAYRAAYTRWRNGGSGDELSRMEAELLDLLITALATRTPDPDREALVERLESAANYLKGYADLVKIGGKTKWGDFPEDPEIKAAHYGSDKLLVVESRLREAARALATPAPAPQQGE